MSPATLHDPARAAPSDGAAAAIIAVGLDLGGTKCEVQLFGADWSVIARRRDDTPRDYPGLVAMVANQIGWAERQAGGRLPVGIGAAGLVDAQGNAFAANLVARGHPFADDIAAAAGSAVTYVNDCRALALSEAVFGAGRGHATVLALILGTGIGGGVAHDGRLRPGPTGTGGEFGHGGAALAPVMRHGLPVHRCGCGRMGCVETYIAGPGLQRMAADLTGQAMTSEEIASRKSTDAGAGRVWQAWTEITAELLLSTVYAVDPDCIVLGGGLSKIDGVVADLSAALQAVQIEGFSTPPIRLAEGGDASGARGAAFAAWTERADG